MDNKEIALELVKINNENLACTKGERYTEDGLIKRYKNILKQIEESEDKQ